jgi:ketosteroid isomerase-like protein
VLRYVLPFVVGRPASAGVLEDYVAAWNTPDINTAADFFTENAIRELIPLQATQHGRDEIRKAMELFFKTIPDAKCEMKESFVADGRGYYEWIVSGTDEKAQKLELRGVDIVQLSGNKIAGNRVYFSAIPQPPK